MKTFLAASAVLLGTFTFAGNVRANAYAAYYDCMGKKPGWTCKSRYHHGHCRLRRGCKDDKDSPVNECLECTDDGDNKTYYPNWRAKLMRPFCGCSAGTSPSSLVFSFQIAALMLGLVLWRRRRR